MSQPAAGTWFGHPKGVFLIAFTELWERFSYFGISALLVLYLTADPADGGWGWSRADAVLFFGFYTGFVFVVPVIGGWIANNHLGERKCILAGALLLVLGHLSLGGPAFLPPLIATLTEVDAQSLLARSEVSLGRLWALDDAARTFDVLVAEQALPAAEGLRLHRVAMQMYMAASGSFLFGLACIVVATGLFKAPIASIVGKLYPETDARRDFGYALFFTCIYLGAVLANFTAGGIGELYGWHYGFACAAVGVVIALGIYLSKEREFLGDLGREPDAVKWKVAGGAAQPLTRKERDQLRVVLLQGLFTIVYAAGFYQKGGLLTLYTRDYVDRNPTGVEIPTAWFLSISTIVFMLVTPILAVAFMRLARRGKNPSSSYKLAAGLFLLGAAYLILGSAEASRAVLGEAVIGVLWLVAAYALFGIGDALVWPNQMALATKLSPKRYTAMTIGAWQLTVGLGIWLAGLIGMTVERVGNLQVFWALAVMCLVTSLAVTLLTPKMRGMMHGKEQTSIAAVYR
jgi:proton-dependent oligopeptide transporter, POT family